MEERYRYQVACHLGHGPTGSNSSIAYFDFSAPSVIWGIHFSVAAGTLVDPAPPARTDEKCRLLSLGVAERAVTERNDYHR